MNEKQIQAAQKLSVEMFLCLKESVESLLAAYGNVSEPDDIRGWSDQGAYATYQQAMRLVEVVERAGK